MFGRRIDLFSLLGFRVSIDLSWFLLAILIVWTLTAGYFPSTLPDQSSQTYLWMGIAGAIGLFVSIVLHEFAHALVARYYDLPIAGITLFVFGGVAEMSEEPQSPAAEFFVAIAGPIASVCIAAFFYFAGSTLLAGTDLAALTAVVQYLALINLVLAIFNMLPAFPLDGGRILRSILWWWVGNLRKATRIAAFVGTFIASLIMLLGVLNIVLGAFVAGMWQLLIGFFIYNAAGASRTQVALRAVLKGVPVSRLMVTDTVTVDPDITAKELVENYFYRHYHKFFPVVENEIVVGSVSVKEVSRIDPEKRASTRVRELMIPRTRANTFRPDEDALSALKQMSKAGSTHYIVAENGDLKGVITMKDLMSYLSIRLELDEGQDLTEVPGANFPAAAARG